MLKNKLFVIFLLLLLPLSAFAKEASDERKNYDDKYKPKFRLSVSSGYRLDNVDWTLYASYISGNVGFNRNEDFEDLQIWQNKLGAQIPIADFKFHNKNYSLFLEGYVAQGNVFRGQQSRREFSTTDGSNILNYSATASGETRDYSAAFGVQIPLLSANEKYQLAKSIPIRSYLVPKIGYAVHKQDLQRRNGTIYEDTIPLYGVGSNTTLNMNYDSEWSGAFIGLSSLNYLADSHMLELSIAANMVTHKGRGVFYQKPTGVNRMESNSDGVGYEIGLKYSYQILKNLSLDIGADYKNFSAEDGYMKEFSNSGVESENLVRFESNWTSFSVTAGVSAQF